MLSALLTEQAALNVRRGRRPIRQRLPRQQQPDLIRGHYLVEIRHAIRPMKRALESALYPLMPALLESARAELERADAGEASRGRSAVNRARGVFAETFRDMRGVARQAALATSDFQKRQLDRQLRAAIGVSVPLKDPALGPKLELFTEENVRLITSIPARYFDEVEKLVLDSVAKGRRWESLAGDIEERFEVSESRAALIARDQVGKFYAAVGKARQQNLGVKSYVWRTMRDQRVRDEHVEREGETFEWRYPPEDGHPGEPIACRCYPEPNLEELLEEIDAA